MTMLPYDRRLAVADLDVLIDSYEKRLPIVQEVIPEVELSDRALLVRMKTLRRWLAREPLQVPSRARGRREAR
jgi:hypothetical protein